MNAKQTPPPPPGMGLEDIYYILFRRKWIILSFSLLGFIAAGLIMALWRVPFESDAVIYLNGIYNATSPETPGPDVNYVDIIKSAEGAAILNTECVMMATADIAKTAAETVGPARVLANYGGGSNANVAAGVILKNLDVHVPKSTQVISASFTSLDQELAKPILDQIITNYIQRHYDLHMKPAGYYDDILQKEDDVEKGELEKESEAIATLRNKAGVVDLDQAMKLIESQKAELKQHLRTDAADIAAARATREIIKAEIATNKWAQTAAAATNAPPAATNATVATTNTTLASLAAPAAHPSQDVTDAYKAVLKHITDLQATQDQLLRGHPSTYFMVQTNMVEMTNALAQKRQIETDNPSLLATVSPEQRFVTVPGSASSSAANPLDPSIAFNEITAKIAGLEATLVSETNEMLDLVAAGTNMNDLEPKIRLLETKRDLDEKRYQEITIKRSLARFDETMGEKRFSNITLYQQPTVGARQISKIFKVVAGTAAGGIITGLVLAFLLEMFLDRSLKRPKEIISQINYPFFLSLPYMNGNSRLRLPGAGGAAKLLPSGADPALRLGDGHANGNGTASSGAIMHVPVKDGSLGAWDENHALHPFYETLRDRLIAYFEMLNLTHRPKLVAVTGCHDGAGVSTIASGLASSLSETGDGNVLLVSMNSEEGEAHQFYKGKLTVGLDDLLDKKENARSSALVQDNLYVVKESTNGDHLPSFLPKRFGHLVSKMKASDYDYIIFDMPVVSQISITPRLARFMDMVLLVVESEKTDRDMARRASALLADSRANVGIVMNKQRSYVPRRLHEEF